MQQRLNFDTGMHPGMLHDSSVAVETRNHDGESTVSLHALLSKICCVYIFLNY